MVAKFLLLLKSSKFDDHKILSCIVLATVDLVYNRFLYKTPKLFHKPFIQHFVAIGYVHTYPILLLFCRYICRCVEKLLTIFH